MVKPVSRLKAAAALVFVAPVVLLSACSPNEPIATEPGTTPPVWTGSPAPEAPAGEGHSQAQAHGQGQPQAQAHSGDTLTAQLKTADGTQVAAATIEFNDGFATVTVQTTAAGKLTPGPHGLHIHAVGKCEANSVAPTGGAPGDFLSAGGHFQGTGGAGHPSHAGDLSSLQVRADGTAMLVTTTSAFTKEELLAEPKTAIIIHEGADNFANIPADRYQQTNGAPPPDANTLATGDAGKRVACGVVGTG
jgi:Cu-Zn family superoxide dismutase